MANGQTIFNVDIYYEALCPDSQFFVKEQLVRSYPDLKKHLHINFIPYGKAEVCKFLYLQNFNDYFNSIS